MLTTLRSPLLQRRRQLQRLLLLQPRRRLLQVQLRRQRTIQWPLVLRSAPLFSCASFSQYWLCSRNVETARIATWTMEWLPRERRLGPPLPEGGPPKEDGLSEEEPPRPELRKQLELLELLVPKSMARSTRRPRKRRKRRRRRRGRRALISLREPLTQKQLPRLLSNTELDFFFVIFNSFFEAFHFWVIRTWIFHLKTRFFLCLFDFDREEITTLEVSQERGLDFS